MSSPVIVFGSAGSERRVRSTRRSAAHRGGMSASETIGWLIFGAAAIALILYLMRKRPSVAPVQDTATHRFVCPDGSNPDAFGQCQPSRVPFTPVSSGQGQVQCFDENGNLTDVPVPGGGCYYPPGVPIPSSGDCVAAPDGSHICYGQGANPPTVLFPSFGLGG